jgi:hypothetical protein
MTKSPFVPRTVNRSTTVIKDRWIDLRAEDCTTPAGVSISPYCVLRYPDWAHVVCLDSVDRICVISQYRHANEHRELREETGIRGAHWRACGTYWTNPATHTNSVHVFTYRVDFVESTAFDAVEDIRQKFLTLPELRSAIESGASATCCMSARCATR